jgi:transcriptional regulator with XRE-family HTH domain
MPEIRNHVQELRRERKLTQEKLARRIGTTGPQINRLEKSQRKISVDWLLRLCAALNVGADEIVDLPLTRKGQEISHPRLLSSLIAEAIKAAKTHGIKSTPDQIGTWVSLAYNDVQHNNLNHRQAENLISTIILASKTFGKKAKAKKKASGNRKRQRQ